MAELTYAEVTRLLKYESETGRLFWRERPRSMFKSEHLWRLWTKRHSGQEALTGTRPGGYKCGTILNRSFQAHRVIWLLQNGYWPLGDIDHIDGNPSNNRIENLRDVSRSENLKNQKMNRNNRSGFNGVYWCARPKKWHALIEVRGVKLSLGYFSDKGDAISSRLSANEKYGFSKRHGT